MTPTFIAAVLLITTAAALVQGSLGLGLALIASPGLSLLDPGFVPAPILAAALVASLWTAWRDRRCGLGENFRWTLVGIPVGIPIGIVLLRVVPTPVLMLSLGLLVLVLAPLTSFARFGFEPSPKALGVGGFVSAVAGSTVGLTGPTVAIVYNRLPPHVLRMTMAVYLSIVQVVALATLVISGSVAPEAWTLTALTLPGTALGLALSGRVAHRIRPDVARRAVVAVCCLAGGSLTVRAAIDLVHAQ
ncbi:TSUP family transporter [Streptomyces hirsutus]|uniref:TSUP family transporter n=1 Tax=Streptomyces hirsutus TaxID=35620 RepID=UPI00364A6065